MITAVSISTPTVLAAVTVQQVREHARIDSSFEDGYIQALILAAQAAISDQINGPLTTETRTAFYRNVTVGVPEACPGSPVQSLTVSRYTDATTQESVTVRRVPGRPELWFPPDDGYSYTMADGSPQWSAVAVCGWTVETLPQNLKHAVLLLAAHLFEKREPTSTDSVVEIPYNLKFLYEPFTVPLGI